MSKKVHAQGSAQSTYEADCQKVLMLKDSIVKQAAFYGKGWAAIMSKRFKAAATKRLE